MKHLDAHGLHWISADLGMAFGLFKQDLQLTIGEMPFGYEWNGFAPFFRWLPVSLNLSQSEFCYLSMTGMIVRLFVSLLILLIPVSGNISVLRRRHASKLQQRQTEKDWQSETWFLRISTKATCSSLSPGQTNLSVGLESAGATINYYQVYFFLPISICQPNNDTVFLQPVSI